MNYELIIGLEIHIQAKTKSKMFCRCDAKYFGASPNSHVCPVCLGLPGALPVPNKKAIELCLKLALALNCKVNKFSKFDRKNYFYPDLPKAYQISQYDLPFGYEGAVSIESKDIRITRVHMEEDTGKSIHSSTKTLLDFNKSGVSLIEVVTEPDFREIKDVLFFAKRLKQIVKYSGVSDADMEKGQMRFELNMSLRKPGEPSLPKYKVEVKNIGSISVLEKVIAYEIKRQSDLLDKGETPIQETRGLRDLTGVTHSQRVKEEANDYRYFPEPDIPPILFTDEQLAAIKNTIGELPSEKKSRYIESFGLDATLAETLISTKPRTEWFEKAIEGADNSLVALIAKWFVGDVIALMKANKVKLSQLKIMPENLRELVELLNNGKISSPIAKQVLSEMFETGNKASIIVAEKGLEVVTDLGAIREIVKRIIAANPKVIEDMKKNPNAYKFLIGQVMKELQGKANPPDVEKAILDELNA
ncbi:Asp-tRNA(Asn)/Glu-tRNA(Gln) amidotransferase subunit GatB [bacterium]|nr:Asp-tRNA(Asn)/Glu-tRNA(Gln) amidotransferase subunit GatB [bacterium]